MTMRQFQWSLLLSIYTVWKDKLRLDVSKKNLKNLKKYSFKNLLSITFNNEGGSSCLNVLVLQKDKLFKA